MEEHPAETGVLPYLAGIIDGEGYIGITKREEMWRELKALNAQNRPALP